MVSQSSSDPCGLCSMTAPRYLVRSFTVIMPYFPTGTMERVDTEGQICTAKVYASVVLYEADA